MIIRKNDSGETAAENLAASSDAVMCASNREKKGDGGCRLPSSPSLPGAGNFSRDETELSHCLDRVRQGDQLAAGELVGRVHSLVMGIVRSHLPRRESGEDLAHEVFAKMFARLGQYRGVAPFRHWLARMARHICFDHLRAQRSRPELRLSDLTQEDAARLEASLPDANQRAPGERLATWELLQLLLDQLPPDDRRIIVLFDLEQRTVAEISASTGWSPAWVKMRAFRARRKLRQFLAKMPHWDGGRPGNGSGGNSARPSVRLSTAEPFAVPSVGVSV